jgi:hypothetical protein
VDFQTWSRVINKIKKESVLDHVYLSDTTLVEKCTSIVPYFGDHLIVVIDVTFKASCSNTCIRRKWHNYQPAKLTRILSQTNLMFETDDVQEYWNLLENVLINAIDKLAL